MKKVKFIHCADLHLGSPLVGLKALPNNLYERILEATYASFSLIIDTAIKEQVDFLLIAGDLYDGEDRSIHAQIFFRKEMERLNEHGIPAFVIHGNHDHLGGSWTKLSWPENVFTFKNQVECKEWTTNGGVTCHLYGYSYPQKHVFERVIEDYQKMPGADFHIGLLHGHDSQDANHYSYAPFTIHDLVEKDFDYWALGHIHKKQVLNEQPYIIYPGNIQGRNKKETGPKGCFLVELSELETNIEFIETAPIRWEKTQIKQTINSFDELYQSLQQIKENMRQTRKSIFLEIAIDEDMVTDEVSDLLHSDEIYSLLQDGEELEKHFVWIYSLNILESTQPIATLYHHFFTEIQEIIEHLNDLNEPLKPLYQHSRARKFLEPLTEQEQKEILQQAENLLIRYLKQ